MENNRIDRALLKETLAEIERAVTSMTGVDDINPYRRSFEKDFARMFTVGAALAVNSGTDALQLALKACGVGPGDSVVVPDLTYIATGIVVKFVGAETILADVNEDDLTLNADLMEKKIRPNTKAIIAVHMFGHPCDMDRLTKTAKKHNLFLIEDACQALGSRYKGRYVGALGDFAAFSFSYYKPLSSLAGNGGMIAGSNKSLFEKIGFYLNVWKKDLQLKDLDRKFHRMTLPDVASVKVKLKYFGQIVRSKEAAAWTYEDELASLKNVRSFPDHRTDVSVRENFHILAENRDTLLKYLIRMGVDAEAPYTPLHDTDLFRCGEKFPVTENYAKKGLHLPLYSLMKKEEVLYVTDCIRNFYA